VRRSASFFAKRPYRTYGVRRTVFAAVIAVALAAPSAFESNALA
jgi:hypothetical protein